MMLPADAHVHSEFSWDAATDPASEDLMRRMCARAERIGLPALVFTEHLDYEDQWFVDEGDMGAFAGTLVEPNGRVSLPPFDLDGYLDAIDRCRREFPGVRILTGVEFGQPHLWADAAASVLSRGAIDRVNGSLHMLPFADTHRTDRSRCSGTGRLLMSCGRTWRRSHEWSPARTRSGSSHTSTTQHELGPATLQGRSTHVCSRRGFALPCGASRILGERSR